MQNLVYLRYALLGISQLTTVILSDCQPSFGTAQVNVRQLGQSQVKAGSSFRGSSSALVQFSITIRTFLYLIHLFRILNEVT